MGIRVEFFRADDPGTVIGAAEWSGAGVRFDSEDDRSREVLARIFRRVPVVIDDPAFRQGGTSGPSVLHPGTLTWFQAAARTRAGEEGLRVRFVPRTAAAMGWDPAGAYRPFAQAVERMAMIGEHAGHGSDTESGEARPEGERGPSEPGTEAARPGPAPSAAS